MRELLPSKQKKPRQPCAEKNDANIEPTKEDGNWN